MRKEDNREKYKEYDHRYYIKHRRPNSKIGKLETKISDLEAKLAEKEKENDTLTAKLEQANEIINNPDTLIFQQQELIDNLQITIKEKNKKQNQKEIEQLEKIINLFEPYENEEKDTILCANNGTSFLEYIDNQIKELKELK